MNTIYSAISNCGKLRKENQDRIFLSWIDTANYSHWEGKGCLHTTSFTVAVFDGMGGELFGEKAAEIAKGTLEGFRGLDLKRFCQVANNNICRFMTQERIVSMGTTAAIVRVENEEVTCCNLGDSRIYLIQGKEMQQLSVDHVMTIGTIRPRRVLTQYLGIPEHDMIIEPSIQKVKLGGGEILLLCSDGLTDMLTNEEILQIVQRFGTEDAAEQLFLAAMAKGGKDNISVIVCEVAT